MNQSNDIVEPKINFEITNNFTVECLGEVEDYVYDIEVEDNHNFFANNILVHNSNYIDLTDLVMSEKTGWYKKTDDEIVTLIDKFCDTRIDKAITTGFNALFDKLNAFDPCIYMKREAIGSATFVAKKRYTMLVYDNEKVRYSKPKLKITGLEAIRSSTPKFFREKMKKIYEMMYSDDQTKIQSTIGEIKKEFFELPALVVAKPTGVNNLADYDNGSSELGVFQKGTPAHVKGALTYNRMLKMHKLEDKYQAIQSGDKVKVFNLKTPNPFKNDRIAVLDKIPKEFDIEKYIDRENMFIDNFVSPLETILASRSWHAVKQVNLDDIFG